MCLTVFFFNCHIRSSPKRLKQIKLFKSWTIVFFTIFFIKIKKNINLANTKKLPCIFIEHWRLSVSCASKTKNLVCMRFQKWYTCEQTFWTIDQCMYICLHYSVWFVVTSSRHREYFRNCFLLFYNCTCNKYISTNPHIC